MKKQLRYFALALLFVLAMPLNDIAQDNGSNADMVQLPVGTRLFVTNNSLVSTKLLKTGDTFHARLEAALTHNGKIIADEGSLVTGRVVEARKARNIGKKAYLEVDLVSIESNGQTITLHTDKISSEGRKGGTGLNIGAGAGIGAIFGGFEGAAKGGLIGLGVSALTPGKQIKIEPNTLMDFYLVAPSEIPSEIVYNF